ncbi:MAG TPA: DMT family transporter [Ktedonobacterales bacterium]|nr:DMT family transporter [Ktedonobacterales bacterium]
MNEIDTVTTVPDLAGKVAVGMRVPVRGRTTAEPGATTPPKASERAARTGLWFTALAWGGSFVAARALLSPTHAGETTLTPTVLAALRFGLASLFFILPLGRAIARRAVTGGDLLRMAALGQITYAIYFWLQYTGVQRTSAGVASILVVGLTPLATAVMARIMGRERLNGASVVAFALGIMGVAMIVFQQGFQWRQNASFALGAVCLIGNAALFAVYSNLSKKWMRSVSPLVMTGGTMLSGALGLLALSFVLDGSDKWARVGRLDSAQWAALLFLTGACSIAAYLVYNRALTRIDASRAAVYVYFEPVVAVALGAALLNERLGIQAVAGAGIIALSVVLLQRQKR